MYLILTFQSKKYSFINNFYKKTNIFGPNVVLMDLCDHTRFTKLLNLMIIKQKFVSNQN